MTTSHPQLTRQEQRVLGVLLEKELAVPDSYPLTEERLLAGCNQKSNRDPTFPLSREETQAAVRGLMARGWIVSRQQAGGRTLRYEHNAQTALGLSEPDRALMAELLLRGPQSPSALARNARRMHPFSSPADVENRLAALASAAPPLVQRLPHRPRERAPRWSHLLENLAGESGPALPPSPPPPAW